MNPWAVALLALALVLIVVAVHGTQDKLLAAVMGKSYKGAQP
jgi:hypothetical protein